MPDDSSADFQIAQRRHADKIAWERELMDKTGMTRSQVRAAIGLQNAARGIAQQREKQTLVTKTPPSPPVKSNQPIGFATQPFRLHENEASPTGSATGPAGTVFVICINDDGERADINVLVV